MGVFNWKGISSWIVVVATIFIFTILNVVSILIQEISPDLDQVDENEKPSLKTIEVQGVLIACISATIPIIFDVMLDYLSNRPVPSMNEYVPQRELFIVVIIPDLIILFILIPYEKYSFIACLYNVRDTFIVWGFLLHIWKLQKEIFHVTSCALIGICLSSANVLDSFFNSIKDGNYITNSQYVFYAVVAISYFELARKSVQFGRRIRARCISTSSSISTKELITTIYLVCFIMYVLSGWITIFIPQIWDSLYWQTSGPNFIVMYNVVGFVCIVMIMVFTTRASRFDMARRELELKSMLVGYFSHEIRTPLNTVAIGVQIIRRELFNLLPNNDSQHNLIYKMIETVTEVELSCDAAIGILDDLLLYEQLARGVESLDKKNFPLQSFLTDRIHCVTSMANTRNISLKCEYFSNPLQDWSRIIINGDEFKFNRLITRLLSNAIQMSGNNTEVLVDVEIQRSEDPKKANSSQRALTFRDQRIYNSDSGGSFSVLIHITDNGATISPEDIQRMFSDGISFTAGVLKASEGLGLSLWIVRKLMILHGGNLSFHPSNNSYGNVFTLSIPAFVESNIPVPNVFRRFSNALHCEFEKRRLSMVRLSHGSGGRSDRSSGSLIALRSSLLSGLFSHGPTTGSNIIVSQRNSVFKNTRKFSDPKSKQQQQQHIHQLISDSSDAVLPCAGLGRSSDLRLLPSIPSQQQIIFGEAQSSYYDARIEVTQGLGMFPAESLSSHCNRSFPDESKLDIVDDFQPPIHSPYLKNSPETSYHHNLLIREEPSFSPPSDHHSDVYTELETNIFQGLSSPRGIVLVVDDALMNRKMMCRLLTGYCDEIVTADDGLEAIEAFKRSLENNHSSFGLILMDYQMPNMDGPTAAKAIRDLGFRGPIIGVTGNTMQHQIDTFLQCGADRVLPKPLHFNVLLQTLSGIQTNITFTNNLTQAGCEIPC